MKRVSGDAGMFGEAGQLVISQDFQLRLDYNTAGTDSLTLLLTPAADYFLLQNLSVGAGLVFGQIFQEGENATSLGANLRLGFNLPYGDVISLWPKVSVGVVYNKTGTFQFGGEGTFFQLGFFAPVLVHPASNFFVGFGPDLNLLVGDDTGLTFGVMSVVGGYF
ncbi:hypothetical protein P2318_28385 [Myxococcaceae bacterium GXIMD 01537]